MLKTNRNNLEPVAAQPETPPEAIPVADMGLIMKMFHTELAEINRHKWFLSEKKGHDVGFDFALLDWVRKHRDAWRDAFLREQNLESVEFE